MKSYTVLTADGRQTVTITNIPWTDKVQVGFQVLERKGRSDIQLLQAAGYALAGSGGARATKSWSETLNPFRRF